LKAFTCFKNLVLQIFENYLVLCPLVAFALLTTLAISVIFIEDCYFPWRVMA